MPKWEKGVSGNPSGRPKRTASEKKTLEKLKRLADDVPEVLSCLLHSESTSASLKVRICELLIDRAFGKPASDTEREKQRIEQEREQQENDVLIINYDYGTQDN